MGSRDARHAGVGRECMARRLPVQDRSFGNGKDPVSQETTLSLLLPLPPGVNNQYVTVGNRRVLSKSARAFRKDVTVVIERLRTHGDIEPTVEKSLQRSLLGVYCTFYFTSPMRRDLDGGLKITLDALGDCLGFDDRHVVDLHLVKQIDPLHPRLEVEIETIGDWSFDQSYVYLGETSILDADKESSGTADDQIVE